MDETNMMTVFGWKIPIPLFVAVVGLIGTLIGAIITAIVGLIVNQKSNRQEAERLKLQLQHEIGQKNRDREMALRRDIFIEAASAMTKAVSYIAKFGDLDLPFREHQAIAENFGTAMAKVHMIAGMEIITKAVDATNAFATINLELSLHRLSLQLDQKNLQFMQKSIEENIAQQQNIVTRIGQLQTANPNHRDISALATTFQQLEAQIQQTRQRHSDLNSKIVTGQLNLSSTVFKRTMFFAEKLIDVNVVVRKELGFDLKGDEETYKKIARQAQEKAIGEVEKYIAEIPKLIEEKRRDLQTGTK